MENGLDTEETIKRINVRKEEKNLLELKIIEFKSIPHAEKKSIEELKMEFNKANLADLSEQNQKRLIQRFVSNIIIYGDAKKGIKIRVVINPNRIDLHGLLDSNGGEGGI